MILVTGGSGMLGSAVVEQLLEQGEAVRVFDLIPHASALVESVVGDIRNPEEIRRACVGVDGVIHVASLVDLHLGEPQRMYDINVGGVGNLIAACRAEQIRKLVYMSSAEVISADTALYNVDEQTPYADPHLTYYGVTKEAAERAVLTANDDRLATCAFRSFGMFGEGDQNFIGRAISKSSGKAIPLIETDGVSDVLYAGNMAHALITALSQLEIGSAASGQAFHVTDHAPQRVQDFILEVLSPFGYTRSKQTISFKVAKMLAALFELPYHLTKLERFATPRLTRHQLLLGTQDYSLDSNKIRTVLKYEPRFTRTEAIERTQRWLEQVL